VSIRESVQKRVLLALLVPLISPICVTALTCCMYTCSCSIARTSGCLIIFWNIWIIMWKIKLNIQGCQQVKKFTVTFSVIPFTTKRNYIRLYEKKNIFTYSWNQELNLIQRDYGVKKRRKHSQLACYIIY